ncbi:MAG: endonuclease/exonuclease/phosphatase family protein [Acidimicrobiales bacterium]
MRLATFNIRHGAPTRGYRGDAERVAAACASLAADVLALQEVDRGVARSGRADLAALAGEASGMQVVFAQTMLFRGGQYGNALLVRGSVDDVEVVRLPGGHRFWVRREPRNAIVATARLARDDRKAVSVAATHLSTQRWASRAQLTQVATALTERPRPHVLLGDLNRTNGEVAGHPAAGRIRFVDGGEPTFPAVKPVLRIDHIALNGLLVTSVAAVRLPISDHLALVVDAEWSDARDGPDRRPLSR